MKKDYKIIKQKKRNKIILGKLFTSKDFIYMLVNVFAFALCIILTLVLPKKYDFNSYFDLKVFSAVIAVFILNVITNIIVRAIKLRKEDKEKLKEDYNELLSIYSTITPVTYRNINSKNSKIGRKNTKCNYKQYSNQEDEYKIPITGIVSFVNKEVNIVDNKDKFYQLPEIVEKKISEIYKAHDFSNTYNQLNIRCCGISQQDNKVQLNFSRTNYYNSLITNRAIDFKVDGLTIRELFAYGPFLQSLEESKLSNHIGFNGFIETIDGHIVFVFRHKKVSIAKNTMQTSVGASLKSKYALNENLELTKQGIVNAIKNEIKDELRLEKLENYNQKESEIFSELSFNSVLGFYRELVEGGKPQLFFYTKINVTSNELKQAYLKGVSKMQRMFEKTDLGYKVDGYKIFFIKKEELKEIYISPDGMTIKGKFYKSVPTSTGTLALFINYLNNGDIV